MKRAGKKKRDRDHHQTETRPNVRETATRATHDVFAFAVETELNETRYAYACGMPSGSTCSHSDASRVRARSTCVCGVCVCETVPVAHTRHHTTHRWLHDGEYERTERCTGTRVYLPIRVSRLMDYGVLALPAYRTYNIQQTDCNQLLRAHRVPGSTLACFVSKSLRSFVLLMAKRVESCGVRMLWPVRLHSWMKMCAIFMLYTKRNGSSIAGCCLIALFDISMLSSRYYSIKQLLTV